MEKMDLKKNASCILKDTYSIEKELSSGIGGAVFKAWHKRLRKNVVIKELNHSVFVNDESRRNETEALKNIKCAYLPQVIDFIDGNDCSFTVMEFIDGDNFSTLLARNGSFGQFQVIEWYYQLACALVELHENDICHGDIKPANIILMPNGKVCLIDFNLAVVKGNDTHIVGRSRGYASPEQYKLFASYKNRSASAGRNVDWKLSDIHNLGATMYHLLTGTRMMYDVKGRVLQTDFGKRQKVKNKMMRTLPCHFIIERSTHPNPNSRFSSALALKRTIQNLITV